MWPRAAQGGAACWCNVTAETVAPGRTGSFTGRLSVGKSKSRSPFVCQYDRFVEKKGKMFCLVPDLIPARWLPGRRGALPAHGAVWVRHLLRTIYSFKFNRCHSNMLLNALILASCDGVCVRYLTPLEIVWISCPNIQPVNKTWALWWTGLFTVYYLSYGLPFPSELSRPLLKNMHDGAPSSVWRTGINLSPGWGHFI